jgi:hypothetical protein
MARSHVGALPELSSPVQSMSIFATHRAIDAGIVIAYESGRRIPQDGVAIVSIGGSVEAVPDEHVHATAEEAMRFARSLVTIERRRLEARWRELGELRVVDANDVAREARNGGA